MSDLPTNRALDVRVAETVMGLKLDWDHAMIRGLVAPLECRESNHGRGLYCRCAGCDLHGYGNEVDWTMRCPTPPCLPYSTDISAAWQVVEHFRAQEHYLWISYEARDYLRRPGEMHWRAAFAAPEAFQGKGDTAPLAICRAALQWAAIMAPAAEVE